MNVFVLTDNEYIYQQFLELTVPLTHKFDFYYSKSNQKFYEEYGESPAFRPINLKTKDHTFFGQYDVFFSLHSKQIFPDELVCHYRCINVHPGLNPYNRGWFPQVFSIINGLPAGVTIHEMDTQLDHGNIIVQKEIKVYEYETSWDVYQRILKMEIDLLRQNLEQLIKGEYTSTPMSSEGNINSKSDFSRLCAINMEETGTFLEFYNRLRATTFPGYNNSYFVDAQGNKVYVSLQIKRSL